MGLLDISEFKFSGLFAAVNDLLSICRNSYIIIGLNTFSLMVFSL